MTEVVAGGEGGLGMEGSRALRFGRRTRRGGWGASRRREWGWVSCEGSAEGEESGFAKSTEGGESGGTRWAKGWRRGMKCRG